MKSKIHEHKKNNFKTVSKILIAIVGVLVLVSCSSTKTASTTSLYKVLVSSEYGGGSFQFYEIITEQKEFNMLLGDDELKKLIKPTDIATSNFILLNMGEKTTGGYSIEVVKVEELSDKIVVTVKENAPQSGEMATTALTNPYTVVKINSKKPIEIK
ncbi:MAG: protease complex subunit PrcB family protein [Bacteroidota bacterium]